MTGFLHEKDFLTSKKKLEKQQKELTGDWMLKKVSLKENRGLDFMQKMKANAELQYLQL